jgi:hypothetical protein
MIPENIIAAPPVIMKTKDSLTKSKMTINIDANLHHWGGLRPDRLRVGGWERKSSNSDGVTNMISKGRNDH